MSGIYIHIPFCKQACHYCNFHFSTSLALKDTMVQAISKEIELTQIFNEQINTIYFGGGTPSILSINHLSYILNTINKKFKINPNAEITLEANPDDISKNSLQQWKNIGINRLSVGIQSFLNDELIWMNRAHHANQSLQCIDWINEIGFKSFSIDLIYGSPLLTNLNWEKNVAIAIEKKIPHISCYALTVEPKTALQKMIAQQKKENVDVDKQAEQFTLLMQWLEQAGYEHYEISNFALPNHKSKHNSSYWQGKKYYAFGPAAHSFVGNKRRWNIANNALYIQSIQKNTIPFEEEILTTTQQLNEYIMTSLRTLEGLSLQKIMENFGVDFAKIVEKNMQKYIFNHQVIKQQEIFLLTKSGKLFADGIAADLFF